MCGRYTLFGNWKSTLPPGTIPDEFHDFQDIIDNYNVTPLQTMPVITGETSTPTVRAMEWGLIPEWARDSSFASTMINARAETLKDKPSFKHALKKRRCLVPMNGFYEWASSANKRKQPVYCTSTDNHVMLAAGLWEDWLNPIDKVLHHTFTIITVPANSVLDRFHERMPAFIQPNEVQPWLYDHEHASNVLHTLSDKKLRTCFVSQLVNNSSANGPELIEEAEPMISIDAILPTKAPSGVKRKGTNSSANGQQGLF